MKVLAYTDRGSKYDHNEDSYIIDGGAFRDCPAETEDGAECFSAAVFDGVGGANAGEIASMTAAREMSGSLTESSSDADISNALSCANDAILALAKERNDMRGMASTVAGILIRRSEISVYNVGDSRVYKVKNGMMQQLTTDDSYENYLIKEYGERVASGAPSHTITACLGTAEFRKEEAHINVFPAMARGERYFVCTDGVTDYIDIDDLEEILTSDISFSEMSDEIRRRVYDNGAKDNFTFIIIEQKG